MKSARRSIPTLSLFSGAGGLDIGFHQAGFDILACVEIERAYCDTLEANVQAGFFGSHTKILCQDIRSFDPSPYVNKGIRCVIGGPPCQTFSAAGRRSGGVVGIRDERGQLFKTYCEILKVVKPDVFVFENVYGITGANGGEPWRAIVSSFSRLGYQLRYEVLDTADYGVPQHRERLIIVGSKKSSFEFPLPTHGPDSNAKKPLVSVLDAIDVLQDPNERIHEGVGGMYGHLLPLIPEGLNYAYFTAEMGHPEPQFAWRSKFHDLLYKVNRNEPCRTIKAQPGKFTGPFHWKNRHFTNAELKRLQSFPDEYKIQGNYSKVLEQIGNSVPPKLAYVLATSVREQVIVKNKVLTFAVRPLSFQSTFRQRQRERSKSFKAIAAREIKKRYDGYSLEPSSLPPSNENYFVVAENFFERRKLSKRPRRADSPLYEVKVEDTGPLINLNLRRLDISRSNVWPAHISIDGLAKYLGRIESVEIEATMVDPMDIFQIWAIIEDVLVSRSRFFTLIDIYGHYANRGDTIRVKTTLPPRSNSDLIRAMQFFGDSHMCGDFISKQALATSLRVREKDLDDLIERLRGIRFDVRTSVTHPIIGPGRMLCTYPFPLLSAKALVESRVQFTARQPPQPALI